MAQEINAKPIVTSSYLVSPEQMQIYMEQKAEIERLREALKKKDDLLDAWMDAYKTGQNEPLVIIYEETLKKG